MVATGARERKDAMKLDRVNSVSRPLPAVVGRPLPAIVLIVTGGRSMWGLIRIIRAVGSARWWWE